MNEKAITETLNALKAENNQIKARIINLEKIVDAIVKALTPPEEKKVSDEQTEVVNPS